MIYRKMHLTVIKGIGKTYEKKLNDAGINSLEELAIADLEELAEKTGISINKLKKWKAEAKRKAKYKKAEIAEDMAKITTIEIDGNKARVKIKEVIHENIPVYKGNFEELKDSIEKEEMAVFLDKKASLWFNGEWYENLPYKMKIKKEAVKKKSFLEILKEWWKK